MKARLRQLVTWARSDKVVRAVQLAGVTFGAACAKQLFEEIYGRLEALEERGLVPLDDLMTVRDAAKIDRRVWVLEGEPGPDPAAAFEEHAEPAPLEDLEGEAVAPAVAEEAPQEGPEAP